MGSGDSVNVKKLKNCRNCFRIVSNHKYVIANGDSVTVYRREDLSVQCTIPSKIFPYAYCCRFLSDDVVMMKNNCAQYMVYDITQESVVWKFKVRGYDSIDSDFLVSSDGKVAFDLVSPSDLKGPVMELIVSIQERRYDLQPLQEPTSKHTDWVRYPAVYFAKDSADGVYMAFLFGQPGPDAPQKAREIVLQHKNCFSGTYYTGIERWEYMEPIYFGKRCKPNGIKYLDSEYMVFEDKQYWNLTTKQYGKLLCLPCEDSNYRLKRKTDPVDGTSFFMVHERYNTRPIVFSLFDLFGGDPIDMRSRLSLVAIPNQQIIEKFDCVAGTEDYEICDIEFLNTHNRFLIGTMSGIYLCER